MKFEQQPRNGLEVGAQVRVISGPYKEHCAGRTGVIRHFLNDPSMHNNGAANVEIMTKEEYAVSVHGVVGVTTKMMPITIRPYIDTRDLEVV